MREIMITVFGSRILDNCNRTSLGPVQSQAETVRVLGEVLRKKYGDRLSIRYVDVIDDDMDQYPEVEEYIRKAGMKLPLLVINGRIIRPGAGLNYMEIEETIEEMSEGKL